MAWTILNKDITPGQLKPLEFVTPERDTYSVHAVWLCVGKISKIDLVDKARNKGYRITFENLLERVVNQQLTQI